MSKQQIECHDLPNCPICNQLGDEIYIDLTDRLFGSPNTWKMSKCKNLECESYWLNPTPNLADLSKLYESYSTHRTSANPARNDETPNILDEVRQVIRNKELGYPSSVSKIKSGILNVVSYLHPAWRDTQLANLFYLPAKSRGRLLDLGCGNGSSMLVMQTHGFEVTGIDFDEVAIREAKANGLNAKVSDLYDAKYPDNNFDAIMMNHVIEHVPEPQKFMQECLRVLKTGGVLTAMTPNISSLGHQRYKQNWRGLEIPRHLQIYTPKALALLAKTAGFKRSEGFTSTQGILQIYDESAQCQKTGSFELSFSSYKNKYLYHLRWLLVGFRHLLKPEKSEVAVLRCFK